MPGEPLPLGGQTAGLGVGGRVGAENLVIPDRGNLRQIRFAGGADPDAIRRRGATRAGERAGLRRGEGASGVRRRRGRGPGGPSRAARGRRSSVPCAHDPPETTIREINCLDRYDQVFFGLPVVNIQLAHLQTLATVARHGNFSRAARELRLTQPAVSMQVRQLEQELGLALLERVGKRTYTTKAGELLLAHAGRAMRELERGLELVQQLRGIVAGRIRLGTSASFSIYLLPSALRRFRARYPQTELVVVTGNAPEITRAVVANELDVGIVSLPVRERELAVSALHRDELVAIGPPGRRWPRRRATPAELAREPLILFERGATLRRVIDDWFQRGGATPASPMELGNTEAIKKLVESGLGLSVTSSFAARPDVRARRLSAVKLAPPLFRQIGIVLRRDKPKTPVLDAFLGTLDELRRSLGSRVAGHALTSSRSPTG
ncbi:MAG: hypothetical protein DMD75_02505 [Candidatus Rokuibacteriota bacterium]|nr:MAG: hypothetical protein DMD75_02505 [Candidatus Rokubacteria bacterium]